MIEIAVLNQSTVVSDAEAAPVIAACALQATRDFAPAYGLDPFTVTFYDATKLAQVPADAWQLVLLDTTDQAGDLGYHELTPAGQPLAKIFCRDDMDDGVQWSVTVSHELMEMLADPQCVKLGADGQTAYEVADPVENNIYQINGVAVSDFVLPSWFTGGGLPAPYDFLKVLTAPGAIAQGGYKSVLQNNQWTEVQGMRLDDPNRETRHEHHMRRGTSRFLLRQKAPETRLRSAA